MFKKIIVAGCVGKILLCAETKRFVITVVFDSFLMTKNSVLMHSNISYTFWFNLNVMT